MWTKTENCEIKPVTFFINHESGVIGHRLTGNTHAHRG